MATLLAISYDIRAIILDIVLFTPSPPTDSPADFHQAALATQGVFLTNRQLYGEASDRLSHHGPLTYHLDMLLENANTLSTSWTCVPAIAQHVPIVKATITAIGGRPTPHRRHTAFDCGAGGPPPIVWHFYEPMQQFTMHNPSSQPQHIDHSLGLLDIDIQTPTLGPNQRFDPDKSTYKSTSLEDEGLDGNLEYVMTPDYIADFLTGHLGMLLAMTYHTASYGAFLYASIGRIKISVDGEPRSSWDLGKKLASFPKNGPVESFAKGRERDWKEFYSSTIESRRWHGLEIPLVKA